MNTETSKAGKTIWAFDLGNGSCCSANTPTFHTDKIYE